MNLARKNMVLHTAIYQPGFFRECVAQASGFQKHARKVEKDLQIEDGANAKKKTTKRYMFKHLTAPQDRSRRISTRKHRRMAVSAYGKSCPCRSA